MPIRTPFIILLILSCWTCQSPSATPEVTKATPATDSLSVVRQPAEYDPQDALWVIWPYTDHAEGYSADAVTTQIVTTIAPHQRVNVTARDEAQLAEAQAAIPQALQQSKQVVFHQIPSEELWVRDMGPNFVILADGRKAIADFSFNSWGYSTIDDPYSQTEEQYDEKVGQTLQLPVVSTELVSEGGDREVNGEGVLLVVARVEEGRNPDLSRAEMEAAFKRALGVQKVIWLAEGVYEDDHTFLGPLTLADGSKAYTVVTTDGHIDEFARFVNDSTILLAEVPAEDMDDPIAQENHRRMEANYRILSQATDQDGKAFKIIRVPMPKTIVKSMQPGDSVYDYISTLDYEDGSTFPKGEPIQVLAAASYLNFLISNKVVLAQKYGTTDGDPEVLARDEQVRQILQAVFPQREVVMIDAMAINLGGGGIHCITMQEPK